MKIKNIQVGDWIEAKNSDDGMIEKGGLYEVLEVDLDDFTVMVETRKSSCGAWWVYPTNFRKPKASQENISTYKELIDIKSIKLRDELIAMYPLEDK